MLRRLSIACLVAAGSILAAGPLVAQSPIQYVYDEIGRLIAVVDPAGDTATYTYDAVGNILSIGRHASSQVSIISFTPVSGPVGTVVTIRGTGFSATANQNTVTFHGTSATVSAASTTQLTVTVPGGATTGTIGVTSPGGSATSPSAFTVTTSLAPTVTSFTPTIGVAGTSVTVTGTNFDTTALKNRLQLNQTGTAASSSTSTSMVTTAPSSASSGHIQVTTQYGQAVSSGDFFIAPYPYVASDVAYTGRMGFNDPESVAIGTATKIGLAVFDATAGHRVSVKLAPGPLSLTTLYGTDGATLTSTTNGIFTTLIEPVAVSRTGTYTVIVDPSGSDTGTMTVTAYDVPADLSTSITVGGSPATLTTTAPGQNGRVTFSGTAGQQLTIHLASNTMGLVSVSLRNPDGTFLASSTSSSSTFDLEERVLPATGTYSLFIDPNIAAFGSINVSATAGSTALTVNGTSPLTMVSVSPSASVTVGVSGGPGNTTDWVAMYRVGYSNPNYLDWFYLNGTKSAPGSALTSATLNFTMPAAVGKYEFRFLTSNGNTHTAISTLVVATSTAALQVDATSLPTTLVVAPNTTVTVSVTGGPANARDWVGLYTVGEGEGSSSPAMAWSYLNGTQTPPGSGVSSATLTFTIPSMPDHQWEFRFFANDGYTRLALSTTVMTTGP